MSAIANSYKDFGYRLISSITLHMLEIEEKLVGFID